MENGCDRAILAYMHVFKDGVVIDRENIVVVDRKKGMRWYKGKIARIHL